MSKQDIDEIDLKILQLLVENSLQSNKEIGEKVHLTGQAVGARIRKLQDLEVIEGYTLRCNPGKLGLQVSAFITVFMKSADTHASFQHYIQHTQPIVEAHRISGEGCYLLRVQVPTPMDLNDLLGEMVQFGNYKVNLSIGQLK